ncbi:MAG: hypothetical protein CM1200mP4_5510 [Rhodospirillaceae bacterium]|nr:MAG: hypothetical protein CM1200mP4_5510 [Rhodospirillaceae bacterium]
MPLVFATTYHVFPKNRQTVVMTILSFVLVTPIAIAPLLGVGLLRRLAGAGCFGLVTGWGYLMFASIAFIKIDKAGNCTGKKY